MLLARGASSSTVGVHVLDFLGKPHTRGVLSLQQDLCIKANKFVAFMIVHQ